MKRILVILLAAGISINMVSCGISNKDNKDSKNKTELSENKSVTIDEAIKTAADKIENGRVIGAEYIEDTIICYDVNILVENTIYDVRVDAVTGDIMKTEYYADKRVEVPQGIISINDAENTALNEVNGGEVEEIALKTNSAVDYYDVKISKDGSNHRVKVNAFDGSVIEG